MSDARGYWDCDCGRECANKPLTPGCRAEWVDIPPSPFLAPLTMKPVPTMRRLYTEAEVTAREAASAEAMREACAAKVEELRERYYEWSAGELADSASHDIRALPIPHADALSRALAAAEKRGMEKARKIAADEADECRRNGLKEGWAAAATIRDAINAAAQEIEG